MSVAGKYTWERVERKVRRTVGGIHKRTRCPTLIPLPAPITDQEREVRGERARVDAVAALIRPVELRRFFGVDKAHRCTQAAHKTQQTHTNVTDTHARTQT